MQKEKIALTFDDGPNPEATPQVLQILKEYSVRATFFVCGLNIQKEPDVLRQIAKQGHLIGNHTFTHPRIRTVLGLIWDEIDRTHDLIKQTTGQDLKIFRPPYSISPPWLNRKLAKGLEIFPF